GMPRRVVKAEPESRRVGVGNLSEVQLGFVRHPTFDRASRFVQLVQRRCERARLGEIVGEQTPDPDAHVVEPSGCIESWTEREREVLRRQLLSRGGGAPPTTAKTG